MLSGVALPADAVIGAVLERQARQGDIHLQHAVNDSGARLRQAPGDARALKLRQFALAQQVGEALPLFQKKMPIDPLRFATAEFAAGLLIQLPGGAMPGAFGHRQQAGVDHLFHLRIGAHRFAPQLSREAVSARPGLVRFGAEGLAVSVY